ncbi:hypothetical protein [Lactococcus lactis]|uniref:hypothetical protein n=1 Tax=Lactococcus lactis TaxID=1358 RepID=UPI001F57F216|nr:hypothetical protein [Lactococcus lactis]
MSTVEKEIKIPVKKIEEATIEIEGKVYSLGELFHFESHQTVFGGVRITLMKGN